ncbi:MAG: hypothetical protein ABSE82_09445 [Nitrososphaerales archaeon]
MSSLADLDRIQRNALHVLGRSRRRWLVFESVNGKLSAPEIAKCVKKRPTHVANELRILSDRGLIEALSKRGNAPIYSKIPQLRGLNLRSIGKRSNSKTVSNESTPNPENSTHNDTHTMRTSSRAIETVLGFGDRYSIENIDQNWVDALVILNFIETATTKFLMSHGYSEDTIKNGQMHWDEKLTKLQAKLYEEAISKDTRPRTSVLTVIKNYREQRNDLDHEAHVATAQITKHDVNMLLATLTVFINEIFLEHKKYCTLV